MDEMDPNILRDPVGKFMTRVTVVTDVRGDG